MGQIGQLRREWENGFGDPTGVDIIVTVYWCSKEKSVGVVGIDIRVTILETIDGQLGDLGGIRMAVRFLEGLCASLHFALFEQEIDFPELGGILEWLCGYFHFGFW